MAFNWRFVVLALLGFASLCCAPALAQDNPAPRVRTFGGGLGGGMDTWLLTNQQVQKELELVDEQVDKLAALNKELSDSMRELYTGLRDLNEEERREKFTELRDKTAELTADMQKKAAEVLMPHQRDRLKQIVTQMRISRGGGTVSTDALAEALELTDAQRDALREKETKVAAELREKIQQAQQAARDELLQVLTPEQRAKLKELTGEPFELQFTPGAGGFGRGGATPPRANPE